MKAAARGETLPEMVADAIDAALDAVWAFYRRNNFADVEDYASVEDWKRSFGAEKPRIVADHPAEVLRSIFTVHADDDWTDNERVILARALAVVDAATLRNAPK
jgi:hypothetical protein